MGLPPAGFHGKQVSGKPHLIRRPAVLMLNTYRFSLGYGRIARSVVLGVTACVAVASDSTLPLAGPLADPRSARLEAFFKAYDCPGPLHIEEYLRAADSHELDYRILPAISLVESTCGAYERMNNRWGWDSVQSGFDSVPAGIEYIAEQLAENPYYKAKTLEQKLFTYNPYK